MYEMIICVSSICQFDVLFGEGGGGGGGGVLNFYAICSHIKLQILLMV